MTKLTIVTDGRGKLIGAVEGHELSKKRGKIEAHVSFLGKHTLHKIEVDFDIAKVLESEELENELRQYIPKR